MAKKPSSALALVFGDKGKGGDMPPDSEPDAEDYEDEDSEAFSEDAAVALDAEASMDDRIAALKSAIEVCISSKG